MQILLGVRLEDWQSGYCSGLLIRGRWFGPQVRILYLPQKYAECWLRANKLHTNGGAIRLATEPVLKTVERNCLGSSTLPPSAVSMV